MRKKFLLFILLFPNICFGGDVDGKGIFCEGQDIFGILSFHFDNGYAKQFIIQGGENKLEIVKTSQWEYKSDYSSVWWGNFILYRDSLKLRKGLLYYRCEVANSFESLMEMMDINKLTKNNKI